LRNAVSHPTLNPNKAKVKTALALVGDAFLRLTEVAIQTTIEHPRPGTTGRATAYRFFLYPYLKNSDGFLSDYYLERLLPDQELGAFSEDQSREQLKLVQKELLSRRPSLVPATDVAVTISQWCQAVLFPTLGMQPQPGPRIVAEQAVFEPTFALAQEGMSIQPEYQGKAAGQELDALIWVLPWRESLDSKADVAGLEGLSAMEVAQQALVQADVAWGVVTNGKLLRLLHKASAHRPRSFLEVDLETISVLSSGYNPRPGSPSVTCSACFHKPPLFSVTARIAPGWIAFLLRASATAKRLATSSSRTSSRRWKSWAMASST